MPFCVPNAPFDDSVVSCAGRNTKWLRVCASRHIARLAHPHHSVYPGAFEDNYRLGLYVAIYNRASLQLKSLRRENCSFDKSTDHNLVGNDIAAHGTAAAKQHLPRAGYGAIYAPVHLHHAGAFDVSGDLRAGFR